MKKYLKKINPKVCSGSGGFSTEEIMQGHKKIRDPKEGEKDAAHLMAEITELRRQREEKLLPRPETISEKKKEEKPTTVMQQRKKKGSMGQWGVYD